MWLKETKNANESIFRLFWVLKEAIWTPRMTRSFTNRWQYEFVLSSGEKKKRQPPAFAEFLYVTVRCQRKARYYEHHFPLTIRTLFRTRNIGDSHTQKKATENPNKWRQNMALQVAQKAAAKAILAPLEHAALFVGPFSAPHP